MPTSQRRALWSLLLLVAPLPCLSQPLKLDVAFSTGADYFRWNIAGTIFGTQPNILSELTWRDATMGNIHLSLDNNFNNIHLRMESYFGSLLRGKVQDSDYDGDDRTGEFSRSVNDSDGSSMGIKLSARRHFRWSSTGLIVKPALFYSFEQQTRNMKNGLQVISDNQGSPVYGVVPEPGPFPGLDSSYRSSWHSFGPGLEIARRGDTVDLALGVDYYWYMSYYAVANWNLRDSFEHPRSFEHLGSREGSGNFDYYFKLDYRLDWGSELFFQYRYRHWQIKDLLNKTYFSDGEVKETQVNEVQWRTAYWQLGIRYLIY